MGARVWKWGLEFMETLIPRWTLKKTNKPSFLLDFR